MNWMHIHLALNHVPVLGTIFILGLLVVGLIRKSDELMRLSLWAFVALMAVGVPIKFTGDFAHEQAQEEPWLLKPIAEAHEQAADQATTGIFLLGIMAIVGLVLGRKGKPVPTWAYITTIVLALATFGLMLRAANSGGQIRHAEIRQLPR